MEWDTPQTEDWTAGWDSHLDPRSDSAKTPKQPNLRRRPTDAPKLPFDWSSQWTGGTPKAPPLYPGAPEDQARGTSASGDGIEKTTATHRGRRGGKEAVPGTRAAKRDGASGQRESSLHQQPAEERDVAETAPSQEPGEANTARVAEELRQAASTREAEEVRGANVAQERETAKARLAEAICRADELRTAEDARLASAQVAYGVASMKRRAAQVDIHTAKEKDHVANVKLLGSARKARELSLVLEEARRLREEAERRETLAMREAADAMDAKMADEIEAKGTIQALRDAEHMFLLAQAEEAGVKRMYADITFHEDDAPGSSEDQSERTTGTSADPSPPEAAEAGEEEEYDEGLADSIRKQEELRRQEELDQAVKRMATLREEEMQWKEEEARKQKKAAKEARKREERERPEREKRAEDERHAQALKEQAARERQAREVREREERERLEAQRRREALRLATEKEIARCLERGRAFAGVRSLWNAPNAVAYFRQISLEFDTITFSESQPFTFESAPWPTLQYPGMLSLDDIDWNMVESFFQAAKKTLSLGVYKSLVEKSHKRFHPDRWSSRRLLATVYDETLRVQIEQAGNIVSQALTPLWLDARQC
jgi:hypothetical protein